MPYALITGASRGIGRACALRFAKEGWDVAINYCGSGDDARTLASIIEGEGVKAVAVKADVSDPGQVGSMMDRLGAACDGLDSLVLNAGIYIRAPFQDHDPEDWRRTLEVNLDGAYHCVRAALPLLKRKGSATVVFVSSQLAIRGSAQGAPYAASKAAMLGLMKSLALELAPSIRVNALAPGMIGTDLLSGDTPERRAQREASVPLGRLGTPEEMADAVWFLSSGMSSYMTGATLHCNGGILMD